jgi:hypothetical protein
MVRFFLLDYPYVLSSYEARHSDNAGTGCGNDR